MRRLPVALAGALALSFAPPLARADIPVPPRNASCSVELLERSGSECVVPTSSQRPELWKERGFERRCSLYERFRGELPQAGVWCRAPLATSQAGGRGGEPAGATPPAPSGDAARPPGRDGALLLAAGTGALALQLGAMDRRQDLSGRNVAVSPLALWTALATLSAGARGATATELRRGLGLEGAAGDAVTAARGLAEELRRRGVSLTLASAVLVDDARTVNPEFAALARAAGARVEAADLRRFPGDTRLRLDGWIARETGGRIARVVPPRTLYRTTRVAVASAVRLVAELPGTFVAAAPAPFHLGTRLTGPRAKFGYRADERVPVASKTVPTRRGTGTFPVASLDAGPGGTATIVVDLPLAGGLALTLVVPHWMQRSAPPLGVPLAKLLESLRPQRVALTIPDFSIDAPPLPLGDTLAEIGKDNPFAGAFDARGGDLSGIAGDAAGGERLAGAELFHEVLLELGGPATAAGGPGAEPGAPSGSAPEVRVDHPFLFFVRDVASGVILVSGAVNDPAPAQEEVVVDLVPRTLGPLARALGDGTVTLGATVVGGAVGREQVRGAMERRAEEVASCWAQQLVLDPRLGGTLTLRWALDERGRFRDVVAEGPAPGVAAERLRACVVQWLRISMLDGSGPGTVEQSWTLRPPRDARRGAAAPEPGSLPGGER